MKTEHKFDNLTEAKEFYRRCGADGLAATMKTIVPGSQWLVVVFG